MKQCETRFRFFFLVFVAFSVIAQQAPDERNLLEMGEIERDQDLFRKHLEEEPSPQRLPLLEGMLSELDERILNMGPPSDPAFEERFRGIERAQAELHFMYENLARNALMDQIMRLEEALRQWREETGEAPGDLEHELANFHGMMDRPLTGEEWAHIEAGITRIREDLDELRRQRGMSPEYRGDWVSRILNEPVVIAAIIGALGAIAAAFIGLRKKEKS